MISLIFYQAKYGTKADKAISFYTGGPYSHVELRFSDGMCFSSSLRDGGTRFKKIDLSSGHWDEIVIKTDSRRYVEYERYVREWCSSRVDLKYNLLGLLGISLPFVKRDTNKWYCSEICFCALYTGERVNISPNMLHRVMSFNNSIY